MPKFQDLTGNKYGRLTVLGRTDDYISHNGRKHPQWLCKCDCGNQAVVGSQELKSGNTKSCGCIRNEYRNSPTEDIKGQRFGNLTILEYLGNSKWSCLCDCGKKTVVNTDKLKSGHTKSCGCLKHISTTTINLIGKHFGSWTVLKQDNTTSHGTHAKWICKCRCGNISSVDSGNLRNGTSTMCVDCYNKIRGEALIQDISGKRFGKLVAIKIDHREKNETFWECKCDCGKTHIATIHALNAGNTRSCGCWHRSKYEDWVQSYLENLGLDYKPQIKFDGLTGIKGGLLSYDFGIYHNDNIAALIECQGQQHFKSIEIFGGDNQLEVQQLHDDLKREYAEELGIPLIEIPYTADTYEKIEVILNEKLSFINNKEV